MQLTRPHAVKTVKYVNPRGGTWTVAAQRVPAKADDDAGLPMVSSLRSATANTGCTTLAPCFVRDIES